MGGAKIIIDKNGLVASVYTADGGELDGVIPRSTLIRQTSGEKLIGLVRVKLEMFVYEKDLASTGKFNPSDFIRKTKR